MPASNALQKQESVTSLAKKAAEFQVRRRPDKLQLLTMKPLLRTREVLSFLLTSVSK